MWVSHEIAVDSITVATCVCVRAFVRVVCVRMRVCVRVCAGGCVCVRMGVYVCARMCVRVHAYVRARARTCVCEKVLVSLFFPYVFDPPCFSRWLFIKTFQKHVPWVLILIAYPCLSTGRWRKPMTGRVKVFPRCACVRPFTCLCVALTAEPTPTCANCSASE